MLDQGYTRLPNTVFDWLVSNAGSMSKRELVVLLCILRNTLGWNRKEVRISCRFIENATGLAAGHVSVTLKKLESSGFVTINRTTTNSTVMLNLDQMTGVTKSVTPQDQDGGIAPLPPNPSSTQKQTLQFREDEISRFDLSNTPVSCSQNGNTPVTELDTPLLPNQEHPCYQNGIKTVTETVTNKEQEIQTTNTHTDTAQDPFAGLF